MDKLSVEEIERMVENATDGPWSVDPFGGTEVGEIIQTGLEFDPIGFKAHSKAFLLRDKMGKSLEEETNANAALIAAAPTIARQYIELAEARWVPIGEIPDSWKDVNGPNGGYVDIASKYGRFPDATYVQHLEVSDGRYTGATRYYWQSASGHEIADPTHAMLVTPPESPST